VFLRQNFANSLRLRQISWGLAVNNECREAGRRYVEAGLNIIPVNSRKKPAIETWKEYQNGTRSTLEDIENWAKLPWVYGWAAVCGEPSGGLIVLDFDVEGLYEKWCEKVGPVSKAIPAQETGSGTYQTWFRCNLPLRNDILAYIPADNKEGREVAIETRVNGGYAVAAPSFCPQAKKRGKKHKQAYRIIQGDFTNIPILSEEDVERLFDAARELDECPVTKKQMQSAPLHGGERAPGGIREAFNQAHSIHTILERNGYERVGKRYLAPSSTTGNPGVYIFEDSGRCYSHHANDPLNDGHSHDAFSAFCILEHGNDFKTASNAAMALLGSYRQKAETAKPSPQAGWAQPPKAAISFISAAELEGLQFPELVWVIFKILIEGYTILAARPKKGKSWLALAFAVAVAIGGYALGKMELMASPGKVLYLALEDRMRRIKARLKKILRGAAFPENLIIAEAWPRLDKGGLEALGEFLKEHSDVRLVVIDSLAKVRPIRKKKAADDYEYEMALGGALQALAQQYQIGLLGILHTKKVECDDPIDEIIGNTGIAGAADSLMVLRRGRGKADGTLYIAGRDLEEQELALRFHSEDCQWELLGDAANVALSQARQDVLLILEENGPKTPTEIAEILGKKSANVKALLWKMAKAEAIKSVNGRYEIKK
jgi:hypothetical protein